MNVTRTTAPGAGTIFHCISREGQHFRVLVEYSGRRRLFVYEPDAPEGAPPGERGGSNKPAVTITLESDEADQLANLLHTAPLPDRMAELERRLAEIAEGT
ncbi:hypothetical protein OSC27_10380 [Microbacterium sp. STN6]|uniref:hypothetical protein n=1 Tax=Microbacterium sp. STN6 TaxID=2995588 RepID=UPI002260904D|nr:hypothetical protein [Microbacterium sp. STN6]MCX7522682.1 hypothetical protein [Microbacterium sp. STN6]